MRASIAFFIILVFVNRDAKAKLYDCIKNEDEGPLIFRSIQQTISNIISTVAALKIDTAIVSLCDNLAPFFLLFLASKRLNETFSFRNNVLCLILSYFAILLLKFGDGKVVKATGFLDAPYVYTFVVLNPILSAAGQIAIKKMSHLPAMAVVWWN